MKKLYESGPARLVIFAAVNLTNLPSIMLPTVLSTSDNKTISDDDSVRHRLTKLDMQVTEMMATKMSYASSSAPWELPSSREPSLQGSWSRTRPSSQQAPHVIQKPTVQQGPARFPTSLVDMNVVFSDP